MPAVEVFQHLLISQRGALPVSPKVLIIGLGNPILGDDGVGWNIAQVISRRLNADYRVEIDCLAVGGLRLMERMLGFKHVILLDSIETGNVPYGTVRSFSLDDLENPSLGHSGSAHDTSLVTALQTAREMGAEVPEQIDIVAVEIPSALEFSQHLSPDVAAAVEVAAQQVMDLLD